MKSESWYDEQCKRLLSNKQILANLLKREIEEYQSLSISEIAELISEPQFIELEQNTPLESQNVKDQSIQHQGIEYDLLFYAGLPDSKEKIGLIINLEVQGKMPDYSILKRGMYYLSRLIARQKGANVGFQKSEYDDIKKVVGIWICNMSKKGVQNVYEMQEECYGAEKRFKKEEYDLMRLVVISPQKEATKQKRTMDLVSLLFSENVSGQQMIKRLSEEYGIELKGYQEEVEKMSGWGAARYQMGKEDGVLSSALALQMINEGKEISEIMMKTKLNRESVECLRKGLSEIMLKTSISEK